MTDASDDASGKLPSEKLSKAARGEPLAAAEETARRLPGSAGDRALSEYINSPSLKLAREYYGSPEARLAREMANSPSRKLAAELGLGSSVTNTAYDSVKRAAMKDVLKPRTALATIGADLIERNKIAAIGSQNFHGIDPSIIEAIRGVQPLKIDPNLASAVQQAQKSLEEAMKPLGGIAAAFAKFEEQHRATSEAMLAALGGPIGDIARTSQWASTIGTIQFPKIDQLLGGQLGTAVEEMQRTIARNFNAAAQIDQAKMQVMLGLTAGFEANFAATQLKMSALAGIGETYGQLSTLRSDAYRSLFGEWRTRPDLPKNFWRDARVRKRMYREAEADDGLVVATPGMALEVMIESGLTAGMRSETSAIAVVTLGEVSMTVRSRGTRKDAYAVLEKFEIELRAYVGRKLEKRSGPDWFKHRASNLIGKAKGIRRAAMERGEAFAPLIEFVELGELQAIVLSKQNWDEVFGEVFINRAEFDHDMQKLVAARRPTMHIRRVDGLRLVELICVVQRLAEQMADDGAWKRRADLDQ